MLQNSIKKQYMVYSLVQKLWGSLTIGAVVANHEKNVYTLPIF
jgi:hypothetical protein